MASVKVNISLDEKLLRLVDSLAKYGFASRSEVMRQALVEFIRRVDRLEYDRQFTAPPEKRAEYKEPKLTPDELDQVQKEHPYVRPNDIELLEVLFYYKKQRSSDGLEPGSE
jgi:Arc/MetJ-type ribon-helix-helix transcriptional regulator